MEGMRVLVLNQRLFSGVSKRLCTGIQQLTYRGQKYGEVGGVIYDVLIINCGDGSLLLDDYEVARWLRGGD
jgi:hypothetical protein